MACHRCGFRFLPLAQDVVAAPTNAGLREAIHGEAQNEARARAHAIAALSRDKHEDHWPSRESHDARTFLQKEASKAEDAAGTLYGLGLACLLLGGVIAVAVGLSTNLLVGFGVFASFIALRVVCAVLERLARIHQCLLGIRAEVSKKNE
jgi:hypothetical protein